MTTEVMAAAETAARGWTVYMLRCADDSLYTGITNNLTRRLAEHNAGARSARYTRARRPVVLVYQECCQARGEALRREYAIKQLSRQDKLALIGCDVAASP